jgi:uncharacterized protein (TIGR02284 family)
MIHPGTLDSETVQRLRRLVAATYGGRDELYAAADKLGDRDLAAICRKLADDLAGHTAYLEQVIVMHGQEPGFQDAVASALSEEIMKVLRQSPGDQGVVLAAERGQGQLRRQYDETISATGDPEAQSVLGQQRKHIEFAERVLRQVARPAAQSSPSDPPRKKAK